MPNERVIQEIENLISEIIDLGGKKERTSIIPNMLVRDASPSGLDGYIIIADNRDSDNILALKVPGVVYSDNDLVNTIFPAGGEAIAFQQGSGSSSSGLWAIVSGTNDIYYDKGDVGIGKSVAPDAALEILSASQAQLRLTYAEDAKYATLTVDTNHDLTIKPSSTGQIILQPTTDSLDFFQVLDADGGDPILNIDSTNERIGSGTASPLYAIDVQKTTNGAERIAIRNNSAGATAQALLQVQNDVGRSFQAGITSSGYTTVGLLDASEAYFQANNVPLLIRTIGSNAMVFATNNILRALVASSGEVMITDSSSTTPTSLLHLAQASGVFGLQLTNNATGHTSGDGAFFELNASSALDIKTKDATPITFYTTNTRRVAIGSAGGISVDDSNNPVAGGMLFARAGTGEPFIRLRTGGGSTAGSQIRGIHNGGVRITNDTGVTEWWRVTSSARVGINGVSSPSGQLHVDQSSTTGAIPVLYLDQADISEEIIWFTGTSSAATADQSLVDASDFTTPGALLGWIKNKIDDTRVGGLGTIDVWIPFYAIPTA